VARLIQIIYFSLYFTIRRLKLVACNLQDTKNVCAGVTLEDGAKEKLKDAADG